MHFALGKLTLGVFLKKASTYFALAIKGLQESPNEIFSNMLRQK